ncbi:MAG: DNA-binding protein [Myxococcales bacterium]|nr:MAG: DNA-binding protein [Myxococcales bacterium]
MLATEARQVRRIVGRMERGEDVIEAFLSLAKERQIRCGWIRALGAFEFVELAEYDQQEQRYRAARAFETQSEILELNGNISLKDGECFVHLHATISRDTDNGIEVLGGHLLRGTAFACEFLVESFDDVTLQRRYDPATGLELWSPDLDSVSVSGKPAPAPAPARSSSGFPRRMPSSSGTLKAVSERQGERPSFVDMPRITQPTPPPERAPRVSDAGPWESQFPVQGDWVEHPQYGLCQIQAIIDNNELVVRLTSGAPKTIRLDFLELSAPIMQGKQRIYRIQPKHTRS